MTLPVPVVLHEGSGTITGTASIYYCRSGAEALCFIQQIELSAPITVSKSATAGEIRFTYTLPPSAS